MGPAQLTAAAARIHGFLSEHNALLAPPREALPYHKPAGKRGVCFGNRYSERWGARFATLRPRWHYSWSYQRMADYPEGVEFVPMVWSAQNLQA